MVSLKAFHTASFRCLVFKATAPTGNRVETSHLSCGNHSLRLSTCWRVKYDHSAQLYLLLRLSLCGVMHSASSQASHGRKSSRSVLCSALWMGITTFFPHFCFSHFFLLYLASHHSLDFCFLPQPHPAAPPWLGLSSSLFLCPQNKTRSSQQWLWHDLTEVTGIFFPSSPFPLVGAAAQDVHGWESWPLTFQ